MLSQTCSSLCWVSQRQIPFLLLQHDTGLFSISTFSFLAFSLSSLNDLKLSAGSRDCVRCPHSESERELGDCPLRFRIQVARIMTPPITVRRGTASVQLRFPVSGKWFINYINSVGNSPLTTTPMVGNTNRKTFEIICAHSFCANFPNIFNNFLHCDCLHFCLPAPFIFFECIFPVDQLSTSVCKRIKMFPCCFCVLCSLHFHPACLPATPRKTRSFAFVYLFIERQFRNEFITVAFSEGYV